jgi:hypothetical protein
MEPTPVALDYLGRIHTSLLEAGRAGNRILLLNLAISLMLLGLTVGGVSAGDTIDTGILQLRISRSVLLLGLQYLSALTFAHAWALAMGQYRLSELVRSLYTELGFSHPSLDKSAESPYNIPGLMEAVAPSFISGTRSGRIAGVITQFVLFSLLLLFPLAAQTTTLVEYMRAVPGSWLAVVYGAPVVFTMAYLDLTWHWIRRAV